MKKDIWLAGLFVLLILLPAIYGFKHAKSNADPIAGAWKIDAGDHERVLVFAGNYYTYTEYDKSSKEFISSSGGVWQVQNNHITTKSEFDTQRKEEVGQSGNYPYTVNTNTLTLDINGDQVNFQRIDDGTGPLAGTWRITGRMQDGKLSATNNTRPRKTLKYLSGTRFQWAAINPDTKEFFGTGGGTYTFTNGKYTENIEFFSRDSSRVGVSLSFDGKVENGEWHHSGKSSQGEPIHEIWSTVK